MIIYKYKTCLFSAQTIYCKIFGIIPPPPPQILKYPWAKIPVFDHPNKKQATKNFMKAFMNLGFWIKQYLSFYTLVRIIYTIIWENCRIRTTVFIE